MRVAILLIMFVSIMYAGKLDKDWHSLSDQERQVIYNSYCVGKQYDIGLTLAAIAWHESKGGRWQIGTRSEDYGIYHINIYWYLREIKVPVNMWNKSKYATILMTNPEIAETYVITKLINLKLAYKDWGKVWSRYNGSDSRQYALDIRDKVIFLQKQFVNSIE